MNQQSIDLAKEVLRYVTYTQDEIELIIERIRAITNKDVTIEQANMVYSTAMILDMQPRDVLFIIENYNRTFKNETK